MDFSSISSSATVVEVFSQAVQKPARFQFITSPAPNRRSHEVRRISALRDRFRAPRAKTSAQPLSHNPRKQWKNPAAAGSGERFRGGKWRRDRDSNPGDGFPPTRVPGVRLRPLGHLSVPTAHSADRGPCASQNSLKLAVNGRWSDTSSRNLRRPRPKAQCIGKSRNDPCT
jgi:hypothetical protein